MSPGEREREKNRHLQYSLMFPSLSLSLSLLFHCRYYDQLVAMENKLPIAEGHVSDLCIDCIDALICKTAIVVFLQHYMHVNDDVIVGGGHMVSNRH